MAEIVILDVGHGNSAVLVDAQRVIVVDVGTGDSLLTFLSERGIKEIEALLISHADADHIAGASTLLIQPGIRVHKVRVNPDAKQDSDSWYMFRSAVKVAREQYAVDVRPEISTGTSQDFEITESTIEVLHPPPEEALGGVGGHRLDQSVITANGLSAVVRISCNGRSVLLPGDLDASGLRVMLDSASQLEAEILVFPHHGGRPGRDDPATFAAQLCETVKPRMVVFSIGRGRFNMPRPDVIGAVLKTLPDVHIACTQLSELCAENLPAENPKHLSGLPGSGITDNKCCAGTIHIDCSRSVGESSPSREGHRAFIAAFAPSALCLPGPNLVAELYESDAD